MKKILSMLTAAAVIAVPFGSFSAFAEEKKDCAASTGLEAALPEKLEKALSEKFSCDLGGSNASYETVKNLLTSKGEGADCKELLRDLLNRLGNCETPSEPDAPDTPDTPDTPDVPDEKPDETPTVSGTLSEKVIALVNSYRAQNGLSAVTYDAALAKAANVRAKELVSSFSHTRPNGTRCFTAFDEAGVSYRGAGENIAMGQSSAEEVMNDWMNSEGHRANILNASFTKIAVGVYEGSDGRLYWAQEFAY